VDRLRRSTVDAADGGDAAVADRDVAGDAGRAGAVDDQTARDDEVALHRPTVLRTAPPPGQRPRARPGRRRPDYASSASSTPCSGDSSVRGRPSMKRDGLPSTIPELRS